MLRKIRLILALIVGLLFLLAFCDFNNSDAFDFSWMASWQVVPAIIAGSVVVMVIFAIITLILGRVYCSVGCPLGILQDVIGRVVIIFKKRSGKRVRKAKYQRPKTWLRYSVLVVTALTAAFSSMTLLALLDPYSNFGRISVNLFKPVVMWVNNGAATIATKFDNYSLYLTKVEILSWGTLTMAVVMFVLLTILVVRHGRIWCSTMCPVGTLLGVLSKYSLFHIAIDRSKCNHCKKCVSVCKAECINDKEFHVDSTRCVECFNCTTQCKQGAIGYKFRYGKGESVEVKGVKPAASTASSAASSMVSEGTTSRKQFLTLTAAATIIPLASKAAGITDDDARYPLPPGAGNIERFQSRCTGCQLCVSACPSHVLRPSLFENGLSGFMQPYLSFNVHKFCEYECKACIDVCPAGALEKMTLEQKKQTQIGVVNFKAENCVVVAKGEYCGACAEHCPTQAVAMREFNGSSLTLPFLTPEICIGCGACESICPVRPNAIFIVRSAEQITVDKPTIEESEVVEVDDFGF